MKPERIEVGDFIYCRSPRYRSQLDVPRDAGLVLEIKRSNYKALYGFDKFVWLPLETIVRVEGKVNTETLGGRLHRIIKRFRALDCELVSRDGTHIATMRIDRLDASLVDEIRDFLGEDFVSLKVVPEGMAFMQAEVVFRLG